MRSCTAPGRAARASSSACAAARVSCHRSTGVSGRSRSSSSEQAVPEAGDPGRLVRRFPRRRAPPRTRTPARRRRARPRRPARGAPRTVRRAGSPSVAAALVERAGTGRRAADVQREHPHTLRRMAVVTASNLRKELAGVAALRRRLVQGRAPRPAGALRPERRRQDDAAADARRRDRDARRRARVREGHAHRAARPAAAARARPDAAGVRPLRRARPDRARGGAAAARAGDGGRRARRRDAAALLARRRRGSSTPAATRWRDRAAASLRGLGFAERRPRPAADDVLRRRADARVARARARRRPRPAAPRRADEPPRRREPRVARAGARRRSTRP